MCARHNGFPNVVFLSMQDTREKFIQRLTEDLIGPFFGHDEVLFAKPSDNYLTGILYGKSEQIPDEEAEEGDNVNGKKEMATKTR